MAELADGETYQAKGSSNRVYEIKNVGGVYSCSCPAWRNQGKPPHERSCKHIVALRGREAEAQRVQAEPPPPAASGAAKEGPPVLLAHPWDQSTDVTGWWISEKLDGVRAYWDGKQLLSRLGNPFVAPAWFIANLPPFPLDGELWGGRRLFQRTVSIVRRQDGSEQWRQIRYVLFDAPAQNGPFEERIAHLQDWFAKNPVEHCQVLEQRPCQGLDHLREELTRIESEGGEGLMVRRPGSHYEAGRSLTLLKVKSFKDDEATVVGHQPGEGRHAGRLGALLLQLANGVRFSVGSGFSDAEREDPPAIGSLVTFRYQELSDSGVPRFPTYVSTRWDQTPARLDAASNSALLEAALAEACDLHSQEARPRLGLLLQALHQAVRGETEGLRRYAQDFPYSRVCDYLGPGLGAEATQRKLL